ncbi:hypothetical protein FSP39_025467 [Pinctada imbricata]|uniref:Baculoviral IAP repeat-containing protein 6 n=1 Tax=Pinctada imbricata TaxID=66713 RepID=A0AA89BSS1_PINIB|nr:hypothetical protein FSP39_025467 [Pinctada imbricata]
MATTKKQWYVGEDGCISVGETASNVTYHSALNSIIVSTKEPSVKIYDVASGALLQKSDLSANTKDCIRCLYLAEKDKVVFCDDQALGARSDLRGMLLLDTALQTPVSKSQDVIKAEIPLIEASQLLKSLLSASLDGVDNVDEVVKELEKKIESVQEATKGHLKTAKWATVCLELPYSKLKNVCSGLVQEMKKLLVYSPGLSVASALIDRLSYLLPSNQGESPPGPVEKAMMYSEVARQKTFRKWPHMNYKWALPDPMAQAGFYHQPNSIGDDRAMCFTCNVCLVCWEPTDEPWSEHERHAPACPFVKGEYTQNVPLCVTYGSQPAKRHGDKNDKIECMSTTTAEDYIATSTLHGSIVVWNTSKLVKRHCHFNLDPSEPVIAMKTGLQIERRSSKSGQQNTEEQVKRENNGQDEADASKISFNIGSDGTVTAIETTSAGTSREIKDGDMYELPPSKPENLESQNRTRPCEDIKVKSLCIVKKPSSEKIIKEVTGSTSKSKNKSRTKLQPTLICGASIRRTRLSVSNKDVQASKVDTKTEEVQLLNKVNKVVSEEIHPRIISSDEESSDSEMDINPDDLLSSTCFIPHLIVTAVRDSHRRHKHKEKEMKKPLTSSTSVSNLSAVPTLGSISMNHDWGILDPLFDSDQDPDCQIVGITPGTGSLSVESPVTTKVKSVIDSQTECSTSQTQVESSRSSPQSGEGGGTSSSKSTKVKAGCVLQCVELPKELQSDCLEISVITPTLDKQHLVVIVSPVQSLTSVSSKPVSVISESDSLSVISGNCDESVDLPSNVTSVTTLSSAQSEPGQEESMSHPGGCILVYKYRFKEEYAEIDETPVAWKYIDNVSESVTSVLVLPQDFSDYQDVEEEASIGLSGSEASSLLNGEKSFPVPDVHGQIVVTLSNGKLRLLNLNDLQMLVEITPPDDSDKFVSATYCTGMERLCACSASGKLHIYQLCEECPSMTEPSTPGDVPDGVINGEGLHDPCPSASTVESSDSRELLDKGSPGTDVLAKQPLSVESLMILHNLIQFENLMPRFTATVPSCWTEIQQEQQQRRHPQHLQHQGEATQHTRTWKLQPDNNTWDEHLFEIVLPRPCCVGHVDVKFNLHSMCTSPPDVQVTLLKQNITSLGRQTNSPSHIDVDRSIDFNISANGNLDSTECEGGSTKPRVMRGECDNNVLDPAFQECHNAEILCGPINVGSCLDLSGNSGVITLTSPQLLSSKPKAFLLHIKGFPSKNDDKNNEKHKEMKKTASATQKLKVMKSAFDNDLFVPPSKVKDLSSVPLPRAKLPDHLKGCDWIQEISVTIRKTKKTQLPRERLQRSTMIDFVKFHEHLLAAVSLEEGHIFNGVSSDHFQNMALDVLMWVAYIQMNDPNQRAQLKTLPIVVKPCLHAITKACYIQGTRTTAHKCSRFLALCMKQCKQSSDPDLAPTFSSALLNALLETLPLLPCANFASSVRLFFTMLNRVKCMDTSKVAKQCLELLIQTSKQYNERTSSLHALLQSRFGLYGHPFDPDLFDCDLPVALRQSNTILPTTSSVQNSSSSSSGNNNNNMTQPQTTVVEELDYYDLFNPPNERSNKVQVNYAKSNIFGLLEVEPLHFTCHSTSDGTKMERMDTNVTGHTSYMGTSGLSGTINFGEMIPPQGAPGSSAATLASLSSGNGSSQATST